MDSASQRWDGVIWRMDIVEMMLPVEVPGRIPVRAAIDGDVGIDRHRNLNIGIESGYVNRGFGAEGKAHEAYALTIHLGQAAQVFDLARYVMHHLSHAEPVAKALVHQLRRLLPA